MNQIRTAVIPIGGLATRFYPITKTLTKCLLPVYNRPVIDYTIDNCLAAGLTRLVFISRPNESQARHYLNEDPNLKQALAAANKHHIYTNIIEPLHGRVETTILEQPNGTGRGPVAALYWARHQLPLGEPFVLMMGDNFLWRADSGSDLADMIESYQRSPVIAACLVERARTFDRLARSSATVIHRGRDGRYYLDEMIEKPSLDMKPRLANAGRMIFDSRVFDVIAQQSPDPASGELTLSDTATLLSRTSPVLVHLMRGRQLDCGTPENWLTTNKFMASKKQLIG